MSTPEPASSWSHRKRHLSDSLRPDQESGGKYGTALCHSAGNPVYVYDQQAQDTLADRYSGKPWSKRIADLPACKKCERAAASPTHDAQESTDG